MGSKRIRLGQLLAAVLKVLTVGFDQPNQVANLHCHRFTATSERMIAICRDHKRRLEPCRRPAPVFARLSRVAPYDPKRCTNPQGPVAFYGPGISSYSTNAIPDLLPQNSKNFLHFLLAVV